MQTLILEAAVVMLVAGLVVDLALLYGGSTVVGVAVTSSRSRSRRHSSGGLVAVVVEMEGGAAAVLSGVGLKRIVDIATNGHIELQAQSSHETLRYGRLQDDESAIFSIHADPTPHVSLISCSYMFSSFG